MDVSVPWVPISSQLQIMMAASSRRRRGVYPQFGVSGIKYYVDGDWAAMMLDFGAKLIHQADSTHSRLEIRRKSY